MAVTNYLIIGNGVAGTTAAENLRKEDPDAKITVVTDETTPFYSRIRLNEYVAGEIAKEALVVRKESWYQDKDINLVTATTISVIDSEKKIVVTESGQEFPYDKLLYSAGSHAFIPRISGVNKPGVFALRNINDADEIIGYKQDKSSAVILGGGLLGLELGYALIQAGVKVTVVELSDHLLPRQLDKVGGAFLQKTLEGFGFNFILGDCATDIAGESCAETVILKSGKTLSTEIVLVSAGVRPNITLANNSGLDTNLGLIINENMQTNVSDIYAAGDLIERDGKLYGSWITSMEQGRLAAQNMAGKPVEYHGSTMSMTLKVVGIELGSAGNHDPEHELESKILTTDDVYKRIVFDQDKVVGCVMIGDKKGFSKLSRHISQGDKISEIDGQLLELSS